jgi:hypothetical protein
MPHHVAKFWILPLLLTLPLACDDGGEGEGEGELELAAGSDPATVEGEAAASGEASAEGELELGVTLGTLDREALARLYADGEIKDGVALELAINDADRKIHALDIDADGQVDFVRVIELEAEGSARFDLQAIPSSPLDVESAVSVAVIEFKPDAASAEVAGSIAFTPEFSTSMKGDASVIHTFTAAAEFKSDVVIGASAPLVAWTFDSERPTFEGGFTFEAELEPGDFELVAVSELIKTGEIKTAAALEAAINQPDAPLVKIDLDADGTMDHVQVVEVRGEGDADAEVAFEFRAVPSSKLDARFAVSLGSVEFRHQGDAKIVLTSRYSPFFSARAGVKVDAKADVKATAVSSFEWDVSGDLKADAGLHAWVFVDRPVYHSTYVRADGKVFVSSTAHERVELTAGGKGTAKSSASASFKAGGASGTSKSAGKTKVSVSWGIGGDSRPAPKGAKKHKKFKKHKKRKEHKKSKRHAPKPPKKHKKSKKGKKHKKSKKSKHK